MAKQFSVLVEIGGKLGTSFGQAVDRAEGKLAGLSSAFRRNAEVAKAQAAEVAGAFGGIAKLAAAGGIVFSVKHAFEGGAELAHELSNLKNAGRSADEVAEGLKKANETIRELPTATLANSVKILNETTGAYGDFKHAVENLKFNSKLGDVLKNSLGVDDPGHELGSLVKMLEIRGTAGNAEKYRAEAEKLGQAMVFYGGRLKSDDLYTFASNSASGIKQLDDRFLTRIAPALIQEQGGDKVGTGLTAFRAIISGRRITDKKQAEAWMKLGLLNDKDIIRNKMGDVTGWKDGAILGTAGAYADPFKFMEEVILPRLAKQGVDIHDQVKLGQALNTLFKNTKANAFATMLSTEMDRQRLHKDEGLMNGVSDLSKIYSDSLLNDPKMAEEAIRSAMTNIGSALTLPLMKPFAQTMIAISGAINHLSAALIEHPEVAGLIVKIGAGLLTWQTLRLANLAFGVTAFARSIGNLTLAAGTGLAARLVGISRAMIAFAASGRLAAGVRAFGSALYMVTLGAPAYLANRLRAIAGGVLMLQAVGGRAAVFEALAGAMAGFGRAVLAFPLMALRGVTVGMWALVANPVGLVITGIVAAFAALGMWVYNNWGGLVSFFKAFGGAFMAALGPRAAGAISRVVGWLGSAWNWLSRLLGPLDATGEKWKAWGEWAGKGVGTAVNALVGLPGVILDFASKAWHALVDFDWEAAGRAILGKIGGALSGVGGYLAGKLGFGGAPTASPPGTPIEARALGGPVSSRTPYLVGEHGPEIFVPDAAGKIETNGVLKSMAAPGGGRGGALALRIDASALDEAGRRAKNVDKALHGLAQPVQPLIFTGSIDEALRRSTKLYNLLDAIKRSPIMLANNGGVGGIGGIGGGDGVDGGVYGGSGSIGYGGSGGSGGDRGRRGRGGEGADDAQAAPESALAKAGISELPIGSGRDSFDLGGVKNQDTALRSIDPRAFAPSNEAVAGATNSRLAVARSKAFAELDRDPKLRAFVMKAAAKENGRSAASTTDVIESMANRMDMNHQTSFWQALGIDKNGNSLRNSRGQQTSFFGPVRRGALHEALTARERKFGEAAINAVRRGSNRIAYRTDQGLPTDPGGRKYMAEGGDFSGRKLVDGEHYWYMGPRGRAWANKQSELDRSAPAEGTSKSASVGAFGPGGFNMPQDKGLAPVKLAGARAAGGAVQSGLSYLVGEKGPEIFTPGAAGGISTNAALGRLAEAGKAVTQIAPSPDRVAKYQARKDEQSRQSGSGSFHAGEHHWHIAGGDAREIKRQVEGCFTDFIRQMEAEQSGSLSD